MFRPCPIRIVIADNEPLATFGLRAQLSTLGYLVVAEATDGREVFSLARELCPDIVVMDVELPNVDGLEASRWIDQERLCPIVLLSECGKNEWVRDACLLKAVQAYLVKPVHERDLEPAIELALARFRQTERLERETARLRNILRTLPTLTPDAEHMKIDRGWSSPGLVQQEAQSEKTGLSKAA